MRNAASVGALVLGFLVLLAVTYGYLGQTLFGRKTARYIAFFPDANGVQPGTRILLAGVPVGSVSAVRLVSAREAQVDLNLNADVQVEQGTVAVAPSSLIGFGDQPIVLQPPARAAAVLPPGGRLEGRKGSPLDNILPESRETLTQVNKLLKTVNGLAADRSLQKDVRDLIRSTQTTAKQFGEVAGQVNVLLQNNRGDINRAVARGSQAVADVQRITAQAAELLERGTLQRDAGAILTQLKATSRKADQLVAQMNELVADPAIRQSLGNVADLTDQGKRIAANVEEISQSGTRIARNAETISQNAAVASARADALAAKTERLLDGAAEIEEEVKGLVRDVRARVGGAGGGIRVPDVETRLEAIRSTKPDRWRTDLYARVNVGGGRLDLGLWDATETNRVILQYGEDLNRNLSYRYGLFAGKAGVGVDFAPAPRVSLRGDVWGLNQPRFDARLAYDFGKGFYGFGGVERVFKDNAPMFGVGYRR